MRGHQTAARSASELESQGTVLEGTVQVYTSTEARAALWVGSRGDSCCYVPVLEPGDAQKPWLKADSDTTSVERMLIV